VTSSEPAVERRARDLIAREDEELNNAYPENFYDQRLQQAITKVRTQDKAQDQADSERDFQLQYIAANRYQLGEEIESATMQLNRLLREYEALHEHHANTLPSGTDVSLRDFLPTWFRHRFGRYDSSLGVEMADIADISSQHVPLQERDPLAQQGTGLTVKGRAG
jgi:hypothetical protein